MTHRIRMAVAVAAGLVALVSLGSPASAVAERANLGCVTRGEFSSISVGATRHQIEREWRVAGTASWDRDHSTPDRDAYFYRRCGMSPTDHRNIVRITYSRHSRIWTLGELKAHGARVEVVSPF